MERNSRKLIAMLERDGWFLMRAAGSHHQFKHSTRAGKVTVPHPRKDLTVGTVRAIYRQAGWTKDGEAT